jgi:lytic murein transglycosylase
MMSRFAFALVIALGSGGGAAAQTAEPLESFQTFLQKLWPDAQQRGVTRATFDAAFAGITPDPRVMALTKRQPEYGKPVGEYLAGMVSKDRIERGRQNLAEHADALASVERAYGVDRAVLVAIWGVETSYGRFSDRWDVIRSLATLAHARFRDPYFRNELLAALAILQARHIAREKMTGSWAGAMGHTQFMPTSFMDYAVDFSGDGRRDIWTTIPDVLASTANYLQKGWIPGLPASVEVIVPAGFDYAKSRASFADWTKLGVRSAGSKPFPAEGEAILFFPSGSKGPAFLVTGNFNVIKRTTTRMCMPSPSPILPSASAAANRSAPPGRATTASSRARNASPCSASSPNAATRSAISPAISTLICGIPSGRSNPGWDWWRTAIPPSLSSRNSESRLRSGIRLGLCFPDHGFRLQLGEVEQVAERVKPVALREHG